MNNYLGKIKKDFSTNKAYYIITYTTIILGSVLMILYARKCSVWMDDMAQMNMISVDGGIMDWVNSIIRLDNNPPLSHLVTTLWMKITPYGNLWLKLPNILFVILGSGLLAETARRMSGNVAGIMAGIMAITASGVIQLGAYTVRPYGLLFCTIAFVLFSYYRVREKNNLLNLIIFSVSLILAMYTHYFSLFICGIYGLYDLLLVIKKKMKVKMLVSYLIAAVVFAPYFLYSANSYYEKLQTFWAKEPNIASIFAVLQTLLGNIEWLVPLLIFSMIVVILRPNENNGIGYVKLCVYQILFVVGFIFIYSKYINPDGSIFVARYFISIAPACILVIADVVELLLCKVRCVKGKYQFVLYAFLMFFSIWSLYKSYYDIYLTQGEPKEAWEEMADYIMVQPDIYEENVAIYNTSYYCQKGWDYYLTHNGQRVGKNAFWYNQISSSVMTC